MPKTNHNKMKYRLTAKRFFQAADGQEPSKFDKFFSLKNIFLVSSVEKKQSFVDDFRLTLSDEKFLSVDDWKILLKKAKLFQFFKTATRFCDLTSFNEGSEKGELKVISIAPIELVLGADQDEVGMQ